MPLHRVLIIALVAALLWFPAPLPALEGDPRAVAAIERMLEQLGGREAWAKARTLYLDYRVWRTGPDEHVTERAWRDLREPNQRIELDSPTLPYVFVFTAQSGWVQRRGEVVALPPARHAAAVEFWPYDFYTIIRSFARRDAGIVLEFVEPRRVVVKSRTGADWGWWEIDANGWLVKWGAITEGEPLEYVYGPLKQFGPIRFPAWGAAVDGSWRFEYAAVALDAQAIPDAKLQRPQ